MLQARHQARDRRPSQWGMWPCGRLLPALLCSLCSATALLCLTHFPLHLPLTRAVPSSLSLSASNNDWSPAFGCQLRSKGGVCIPQFFDSVDDVYRPLWPGQVDVLVRSYFSPRLFLLSPLWLSLSLLWPKGIGRRILVLDEGDQVLGAEALVPPWVEVKYEENYMNLPGKILQQWSYGWADNYSSAPYIAIFDDDVILNLKVTPALLFNLSSGLPYVLGSKEQGYYRDTTRFFLGRHAYFANFMVSLPFLQPRAALPLYRQKVAELHSTVERGYDGVMQWWAQNGGKTKDQIAHTVMGNFLFNYAREMVSFSLEWADNTPVPRTGVHVPYSQLFKDLGGVPRTDMLNSTTFLVAASYFIREAICFSLPPGEAPNCKDMPQEQRHIWRYAWDRERWRAIRKRRRGALSLYQEHISQLHCIFRLLEAPLTSPSETTKERLSSLLGTARQTCLHS